MSCEDEQKSCIAGVSQVRSSFFTYARVSKQFRISCERTRISTSGRRDARTIGMRRSKDPRFNSLEGMVFGRAQARGCAERIRSEGLLETVGRHSDSVADYFEHGNVMQRLYTPSSD